MTILTRCFTQTSRSCISRGFDLCTIRLTANGADGRSGCAASCSASSRSMRSSHSSSTGSGRAFSDGNAPMMPALHCAITRSGCETMNSGAPMTGTVSACGERITAAVVRARAAISFGQSITRPSRTPRMTASVRVVAPSFARIAAT